MVELRRWAIWLAILGAVGSVGCDAGETGGTGGTGGGAACPDDPSDGPVSEACGIWVSAGRGKDTNDGTQGAPVATLTHAIELAEKGPHRVYACGETWTESLTVPSGVSLHGGFDCESGWAYGAEANRARLTSPSPTALVWFDGGNQKSAFLTDFYVESADAEEPGEASIAVFVRDELPLSILRSELVAGDGRDGADGDPGDPEGLPAMAGTPGSDGADACSGPVSKGGASPESACADGSSRGGAGGDSSVVTAESGAPGEPIGEPPLGMGGLGEQIAPTCTPGSDGADGADGAFGIGGGKGDGIGEYGRLTPEGYISASGSDGKAGSPGQGGGGGGARFGSMAACGGTNSGGAAGGSGGSGGCGGKGGRGGQGGGASIAFASRSASVLITYSTLRAGYGGSGGDGGEPQQGGPGGQGGKGGQGAGPLQGACAGGRGGMGGVGGMGGGGRGGPSAALGVLRDLSVSYVNIETFTKDAGHGGLGAPNEPESHGSWGFESQVVSLDR